MKSSVVTSVLLLTLVLASVSTLSFRVPSSALRERWGALMSVRPTGRGFP